MQNTTKVTQKTKNRVAIWSSYSTPGHISRQNCKSKIHMHPYAHSSITDNSHDIDITRTPTDRRADKQDVAMKKNEIMPYAATRMDAETSIRSEIVRTRETNPTWCDLYVESKVWYKWTYYKTDSQTMERGWGGIN